MDGIGSVSARAEGRKDRGALRAARERKDSRWGGKEKGRMEGRKDRKEGGKGEGKEGRGEEGKEGGRKGKERKDRKERKDKTGGRGRKGGRKDGEGEGRKEGVRRERTDGAKRKEGEKKAAKRSVIPRVLMTSQRSRCHRRSSAKLSARRDGRTDGRNGTGPDGTGRAAGAAELREPPTRGAKPPRQPPLSHATQLGPGPTAGRKCEGVNIRPPCDRCRPVRMRSLGLLAHALCVASVSTATEMSAMGEPEVDAAVAEKFEMKRRLGKGVSAEGLRGAPLRVLRCPRSPCRAAAPPFRSAGRGSIPAAFIRSLK